MPVPELKKDRVEYAVQLFKSGANCSQAVFTAFSDIFGMDTETAMRVSAGLGGGVGRMREVCGTVSAMAMLAGMKYGGSATPDPAAKARTYEAVQALAEEFKKTNCSVVCRELLNPEAASSVGGAPEERTEAYYKKRPCADIVADAARAVQKLLIDSAGE